MGGGISGRAVSAGKTGKGDFVTAALQNAGIWMLGGSIIQAQEKYNVKFPKERAFLEKTSKEWLKLFQEAAVF